MSIISSLLFTKAKADINEIFDPAKVPGSSVYSASNGTDLGMQAIFAASFFVIIILVFSALRLRWPYIFSPRTRLTITAPPFLSKRFFGWILATMRTPETHILNTLGLDSVIFLRFYKMCIRLLLDVAFFSIVIIWPLNIRWSKSNLNPQTNGNNASAGVDNDGDLDITLTYSVTDYLFNLTLNTADPKQKWYLVPHIVFVYVFSGLAYYHISKFSSHWASLRWHFLMQSRHARVSRTVMLTDVPKHLASSPRELEWFCGPGLQLGNVEQVRVCPFNTRLTSSVRERARYLVRLEHAYKKLLGNPCVHPEYDPEKLRALAMDPSQDARCIERQLLEKWAKPSKRRSAKHGFFLSRNSHHETGLSRSQAASSVATPETTADSATASGTGAPDAEKHEKAVHNMHDSGSESGSSLQSNTSTNEDGELTVCRPTIWIRSKPYRFWRPWQKVDAIDYWRSKFLAADQDFRQLRDSMRAATGTTPDSNRSRSGSGSGSHDGHGNKIGYSTTAFVTFEDAATAHMFTQLSCYPNPGFMKARLAPEPRGVYWPNIWISSRRKWLGFTLKWLCIFVIWAFWSVPVILFSSLLTPASLAKIFPSLLESKNGLLRSFLSSTVPSVFLLLFLNMLPWILKQVHFVTGVRTKPDIDYSVMTKMWAFLVFNVILIFGISGTFWDQILNVVNDPGTVMQNLASNIPRVGTFFTGYILVLGVAYQPFKLLQLRPVIWHIGRQWLCNTPRDYARLVSPVYIDWYSVYPYPLLVFAIAMIYSTFSPPVVVGAVIYFLIGYPVMKYLLLYVYFHPFETAGMAWPKVCRRMIFSIILYQIVILTFVIVKGGGWYTFSMVPIIVLYLWFFYHVGWSLEKQGTVLPVYLWRNPPPNSSYPLPPEQTGPSGYGVDIVSNAYGLPTSSEVLEKPSISALRHISTPEAYADSRGRPMWNSRKNTASFGSAAARSWSRMPWPPQQPGRSASFLSPGQLRASENRVVKRVKGHHHRECSRGARTREIILDGRLSTRSGSCSHRGRQRPVPIKKSYTLAGPTRVTHRSGSSSCSRDDLWNQGHDSAGRSWSTELRSYRQNCHNRSGDNGMRIASNSPFRQSRSGSQQRLSRQPKRNRHGKARRRKRYKSLAEAATAEGSRLIMSLGRLPSEIYSRREKSKRSSLSQIDDGSLPKSSQLPGPQPQARRNASGNRPRPWSFAGDKLQLLRLKSTLTRKESSEDSIPEDGLEYAGSADSGLAIPPIAHSKTTSSLASAFGSHRYKQSDVYMNSPLAREVSLRSSRLGTRNVNGEVLYENTCKMAVAEANADYIDSGVNENSSEWVDEDVGATSAFGTSASFPGQRHWREAHGAGDWDPLVYLKPSVSDSHAQELRSRDGVDATLGTLLANLGSLASRPIPDDKSTDDSSDASGCNINSSSSSSGFYGKGKEKVCSQMDINNQGISIRSGLRQRCRQKAPKDGLAGDSMSSVGYKTSVGEAAAASIIDAERSPEYNTPPLVDGVGGITSQEPDRAYGFSKRLRGTLQRMRDYFLADFRPAGPILDLTYDRMYSQGLEDTSYRLHTNENGELVQDNGDTLPPLRHILGRVLPRSVSRSFNQSQDAPAHLLPTATVPPLRSPNTLDMGSPYFARGRAATSPRGMELPPATTMSAIARRSPAQTCGPSLAQVLANSNGASESNLGAVDSTNGHHQRSNSAQPMLSRLTSRSPPLAAVGDSEMWFSDMHQHGIDDLPQPPRAPWLESPAEPLNPSPSTGHLRSASQPPQMQKQQQGIQSQTHCYQSGLRNPVSIGQTSSSSGSPSGTPGLVPMGGQRASHKNSLPPHRAPLPARVVSELNYVSRHSATPSGWLNRGSGSQHQSNQASLCLRDSPFIHSQHAAEEEDQLMTANYQRFAVEAQSTFEPDEFTDYSQTPMLNFPGILDRGIRDYVHPGLVGELPTLWLPTKGTHAGGSASESDTAAGSPGSANNNEHEQTPADAMRILALSAPRKMLGRMVRQIGAKASSRRRSNGLVGNGVGVEEQAYYASDLNSTRQQQQMRCPPHSSMVDEAYSEASNGQADLTPLTPIIEVATPRSSMMAENRDRSAEDPR
ncbi:hypothetical protein FB645_001773 [Coemansia sp. IMI 203386]|nr:hypothetical protein FB645_001773 [Coemansia sp. IMI 203386]